MHENVNDAKSLEKALEGLKNAQKIYSSYTQEQVDGIFAAAAKAANNARIPLARMAFEETGMGVVEDKTIKNHYASEYVYNAYKNTLTCGIIERDSAGGIIKTAHPIGVIAAVIPTTNPTSTAIFKCLLALKTRNAIMLSAHPRAKNCTAEAARIVLEAAVKAGAPEGIIDWIDTPSAQLTEALMKSCDMILATGGPGMVKAAYSSGKPAVGVGAGNTPALIDESADIAMAVNHIIISKTFDNGMICASEQAAVVCKGIADKVKLEFEKRGCVFTAPQETQMLADTLFKEENLNPAVVGKSAHEIARMAGFEVPESTRILICPTDGIGHSYPLSREKLCPVLAFYEAESFEEAVEKSEKLVQNGGAGHTASLFIDPSHRERLESFSNRLTACRIIVNSPASHGAIGDIFNFRLAPSLTLGCGSWGGNSVAENVGVKQLLNIKTVAERRENMLWFRTPQKIFLKRGCLGSALEELKNKKRIFVVTDEFLFKNGFLDAVTKKLSEMGISTAVFSDVQPDPTLASAREGARSMTAFEPDAVIAFGGGSAMDAAKIMWLLYEHPDTDFGDLAMRFFDIRKRVYSFPEMGGKADFIAIPTTAGTGSEVTPFAVITDSENGGIKYPLADYELMPDMAIVDADLQMKAPKSLTAASGIDALTHALEAYVSMVATDYTDALALKSLKTVFEFLPRAFEHGENDPEAREKMADAATMAGMAFANAFLGICHSMAHKLGSFFHLPHGVSNALLITHVMRYNASEKPVKPGVFPQYKYPSALRRYGEIASALGLEGQNDCQKLEKLIEAVDNLKEKIGVKHCIRDYGVDEKEFADVLDKLCEMAFDDQCTGANPRYPLMSEMKEIYLKAYYGE
ncbi:MAG: bifunctional acetaldehyde-CoA/alcohol dehydrogenase [Ruminococcaceae bacterium]|nr:bifunctional acetaldehyde-CoA/alcohol dehydrogenase [Oscillospiraceae bacterium]